MTSVVPVIPSIPGTKVSKRSSLRTITEFLPFTTTLDIVYLSIIRYSSPLRKISFSINLTSGYLLLHNRSKYLSLPSKEIHLFYHSRVGVDSLKYRIRPWYPSEHPCLVSFKSLFLLRRSSQHHKLSKPIKAVE